jgi:hypothetical protein
MRLVVPFPGPVLLNDGRWADEKEVMSEREGKILMHQSAMRREVRMSFNGFRPKWKRLSEF